MHSMTQGCSLKRFLHVPQEAAGGYTKREGMSVFSELLSLFFAYLPLRPFQIMITVERG